MDAHDLHRIRSSRGHSRGQFHILLFQPVQIPDKGGQPTEASLFKPAGIVVQQPQVGQPPLAMPPGAGGGGEPGLLI